MARCIAQSRRIGLPDELRGGLDGLRLAELPDPAEPGYRPLAEAAGLPKSRPYDLPHSFGSLIHEGVPPVEVTRRLGSSDTVRLETYAQAEGREERRGRPHQNWKPAEPGNPIITRADQLSPEDVASRGKPHGSTGFTPRRWRPKTPNDRGVDPA